MANITYTITQDGDEISYTINDGVGPAGPNNITTATSTDITGILKGDGANVSAAVDGTDYLTPSSVDARIADAINFFEDYFFTATPDALGGIYYEMKDTNGGVSADLVSGTLAAGNDQALLNFINNAGLGVSQLEGGYYELHVHASKTGTKATTIYAEIYTRTIGGTETLIGTTEVSGQLTGSDAVYDLTTRISDTPINTTDKLVVKWYANVGSAGSDVAVTIKVDGNTNSRIHVPVTTEILAQKYQAILAEGSFVDGDKTKLDGIEAGATADQTAAEILTAIKTVDGTGSGLDADLLDGQEASSFATSAQGALADSAVQPGDITTLAELNAIITDATLIDTIDSRLSDARTPTAHSHTASDLDFAGSTDIGADLADADEVLVSDGGGNTTRVKSALSRFWTYIKAKIDAGLTIAGNQSFSGQVELTGQAASTDDSAMTRSLSDLRHKRGDTSWYGDDGIWAATTSGSGSTVKDEGYLYVATGTTTGSIAQFRNAFAQPWVVCNTGNSATTIGLDFDQEWVFRFRGYYSGFTDVKRYFMFGALRTDTAATQPTTKSCGFEVDAGSLYAFVHNGSTYTKSSSSILDVSTANIMHEYLMRCDGTNIEFYVDGSLLDTLTAPSGFTAANGTAFRISVDNTTGTTNADTRVMCPIDWYDLNQ